MARFIADFVEAVAVGAANFRHDAAVGFGHVVVRTQLAARNAVGFAASIAGIEHVSNQPVGLGHELTVNQVARVDAPAGLTHGTAQAYAPSVAPVGFDVTQISYTNVVSYDMENTTGYAVGADNDWADAGNFDGRDSDEASISGGKGTASLTPKAGGIRADVIEPRASKDDLNISSVELRIYLRQTGTLADNGTLSWGIEGTVSRTELGAETGDVDQEYVYDLTIDIAGDWDNIRGLQVYVEGSSALAGRSCFARQAYLVIEADLTEAV